MDLPFNQFGRPMSRKSIVVGCVLAFFVLATIFFAVAYVMQVSKTQQLQHQLQTQQTNKKVVDFLNLFIEKVLKTDQPVSFDDRLQLENAIRGINDPQVLAKWEQFTNGTNEAQIQAAVKDLLQALVNKIVS